MVAQWSTVDIDECLVAGRLVRDALRRDLDNTERHAAA